MSLSLGQAASERVAEEESIHRDVLRLRAELRAYQAKCDTLENTVRLLLEKEKMKDVYKKIIQHED